MHYETSSKDNYCFCFGVTSISNTISDIQTGVNLVVLLFFTQFLRNVTFNMQQSIGIHTGTMVVHKGMEKDLCS